MSEFPEWTACVDTCINRVMHIECSPRNCPCREHCRNQRFQKRKYCKLEKIKTKKKGFGLIAKDDIPAGAFVIEYCGEVISTEECQERLMAPEEAGSADRHFYFLTIDSNCCIDASKRGNKARFINHSCNPNCETQKWNVNGEMRVGIFALDDIKKGSEVTFDYQFERVGVEKQRCYCGEPNCRGYIGDKPDKLIKDRGDRGGDPEDKPSRRKVASRPVRPVNERKLEQNQINELLKLSKASNPTSGFISKYWGGGSGEERIREERIFLCRNVWGKLNHYVTHFNFELAKWWDSTEQLAKERGVGKVGINFSTCFYPPGSSACQPGSGGIFGASGGEIQRGSGGSGGGENNHSGENYKEKERDHDSPADPLMDWASSQGLSLQSLRAAQVCFCCVCDYCLSSALNSVFVIVKFTF